MSAEETSEAPNWLAKLEEQRERRLKVKLGHEAGAGAPCQNCGDKCPGLDLHFWRKICKLCKCGKEDHDISDDDVYGFVQFQLLGSKPTKAKNIFLTGKKDALTLDWMPKGSNTDVKKYLEELPEDLLPVKGSEAARLRKQRLQKQTPAHDIDATLCHALSPDEIQQLEEYVAHIRKHSVGQGKIIQLPMLRSEQHKFGSANSQFLTQHAPGQLASSQPVYLHSSSLTNNLHNLTLRDKQPTNNRTTFLNSQLPNAPALNTIDEQSPETVGYRTENMKVQPNYAPKSIHQITDSQNPISVGKTNDLLYPVHHNTGISNPAYMSDHLLAHDPVMSENYYTQNPEYLAKMSQNAKHLSKNSDLSTNQIQDPISSEKYSAQNPEFAGKMNKNQDRNTDFSRNIDNKLRITNPNINLVHSTQNNPISAHNSENLTSRNLLHDKNTSDVHSVPYSNQNVDDLGNTAYGGQNLNRCFGNMPFNNPENFHARQQSIPTMDSTQNMIYSYPNSESHERTMGNAPQNDNMDQNEPYNSRNLPYNYDRHSNIQDPSMSVNYPHINPEFSGKLDKHGSNIDYDTEGGKHPNIYGRDLNYAMMNHPENMPIQLPLTTSNVERHQEQFLNQDYPQMAAISESEFKNRVPIPVFNAENKINPLEYEQNLSSVGYIRDIDYNRAKVPNDSDLANSNLIPTCHKCKKLFDDGSIAVAVDRTDSLWHANCFTCHTCAQPLADLLYFYHKETDNIYCGRDYALLKGIPRCAACDELIFVREYCLAEERTFHIKHFCCFECDEPLAGKQYLMENNQPNCVDCYEKLKAEKCTDCGYVIGPEEQGVSLQELHWHASDSCFACKYCRKGLLGGKMLLRNQNLFCSDVCFKTYHA